MSAIDDITTTELAAYEGKDIADICNTGYDAANVNHCAHFVSHVLEITIGLICGSMKYDTRGTGTSLRVNEIYNSCSTRGVWADKPISTKRCLVFATRPSNMDGSEMGEHPRKHIGIYVDRNVWHYSNSGDKVVKDSVEAFLLKFKGAYGSSTALYYGVL